MRRRERWEKQEVSTGITVSHFRDEMRWDGQAEHGKYMRVTPIVGDVLS